MRELSIHNNMQLYKINILYNKGKLFLGKRRDGGSKIKKSNRNLFRRRILHLLISI